MTAITISDLHVERGGRPVLTGVTLDVSAGSVTGLLGPSGCGKTTLMRAIVGVQIVAGGHGRRCSGEAAGSREPAPRGSGYVTQAPSVYGDLSVRGEPALLRRDRRRRPRRAIAEVIETVGLGGSSGSVVGVALGRPARARLAGHRAARRARAAGARRADGRARPGAARRAVGDVPRAGRRGHDAAGLEPRDGRGERVRRRCC